LDELPSEKLIESVFFGSPKQPGRTRKIKDDEAQRIKKHFLEIRDDYFQSVNNQTWFLLKRKRNGHHKNGTSIEDQDQSKLNVNNENNFEEKSETKKNNNHTENNVNHIIQDSKLNQDNNHSQPNNHTKNNAQDSNLSEKSSSDESNIEKKNEDNDLDHSNEESFEISLGNLGSDIGIPVVSESEKKQTNEKKKKFIL